MAQQTHYLTKEWFEKLQAERLDLIENQLPATLERLKEAISQWDISENAEYDTSMSEKELIEGRIKEIDMILENVEIIEHKTKWGEVRYGSVVSFVDDKDREHTLTIVGTGEVDILANTISLESPLWQALRWKVKWDNVAVKSPARKYMITITNVE